MAVVVGGTSEATLLDVVANSVVARVPLGGPARSVAFSPAGGRAYVAADSAVAMATGSAGGPLLAVGGKVLYVLDPASLRRVATVGLHGTARGLGVSAHGGLRLCRWQATASRSSTSARGDCFAACTSGALPAPRSTAAEPRGSARATAGSMRSRPVPGMPPSIR